MDNDINDCNDDEIILEKDNVFIYRIPNNVDQNLELPRRAADWDLSNHVKICKLTVAAAGPSCHIQLEDDDGYIFGQSVVNFYPGGIGRPSALNGVTDSSRYFTLKTQMRSGECEFLGLGFFSKQDSSDLTRILENYLASGSRQIDEKVPVNLLPECKSEPIREPLLFSTLCPKEVEQNYETEANSVNIQIEQENSVDNTLQTSSKGSETEPEFTEALASDPKNICENTTVEQNLNEKKEVLYDSCTLQLAKDCNISVTEASKLNETMTSQIEMFQKKKLNQSDPHQSQSEDKSSCGFCYRLPGKVYQCHLCPANFLLSTGSTCHSPIHALTSHWMEVHDIKGLNCVKCCLIFSNKTQYYLHLRWGHAYSCFVCHNSIGKIPAVRRHLVKCHKPVLLELVAKHRVTKNESENLTDGNPIRNGETDPDGLSISITKPENELQGKMKSAQNMVDNLSPKELARIVRKRIKRQQYKDETTRRLNSFVEILIKRHRTKNLTEIDSSQFKDKSCSGFCYSLPDKVFKCHLCPATFCSRGARGLLENHWKDVHQTQALNCESCNLVFSTDDEAQFTLHNKLVHDFSCCFCSDLFGRMRGLRRHLLKQHKGLLLIMEQEENKVKRVTKRGANEAQNSSIDTVEVEISAKEQENESDHDEINVQKRGAKKALFKKRSATDTENVDDLQIREPVCKVSKLNQDQCSVQTKDSVEESIMKLGIQNSEEKETLFFNVEQLINMHCVKKYSAEDKSVGGICYSLPDNSLQCHLCPTTVPRSKNRPSVNLENHWKQIHKAKALNCKICDLVFSTTDQYILHNQLPHDFRCCFCSFRLKKKLGKMRNHLLYRHKQQLLDLEFEREKSAIEIDAIVNNIKSSSKNIVHGEFGAAEGNSEESESENDSESYSNNNCEGRSVEQNFNERKVVKPSKFEQKLARKCDISLAEAVELSKNISLQIEIIRNKDTFRKKRGAERERPVSREPSCGGFRYLISEKGFQCHLCPANFPRFNSNPKSLTALESHWMEVHRTKFSKCIQCSLVFSNETEFSSHMKLKHYLPCCLCKQIIGEIGEVELHLLNFHKPNAFLKLIAKQELTESNITVTVNGDPKTTKETNPVMNSKTRKRKLKNRLVENNLLPPQRSITIDNPEDEDEEESPCKIRKLNAHQNNEEEKRILNDKIEKLINRYCKHNKFKPIDPFQSEDESCGGICYSLPDKSLQCHFCQAAILRCESGSSEYLENHWKEVHQVKFLNCRKCDLVFSTSDQFTEHNRMVHNFDCCFCTETFGTEDKWQQIHSHLSSEHRQQVLEFEFEAEDNNEIKIDVDAIRADEIGSIGENIVEEEIGLKEAEALN